MNAKKIIKDFLFLIGYVYKVNVEASPKKTNPTGKQQNIVMEMNKSKTLYSRNDEGLVIGRPVAKLALSVPISRSLHTCKRWNRLNWLFVVHYYCFFCCPPAKLFFKKNRQLNFFYLFSTFVAVRY